MLTLPDFANRLQEFEADESILPDVDATVPHGNFQFLEWENSPEGAEIIRNQVRFILNGLFGTGWEGDLGVQELALQHATALDGAILNAVMYVVSPEPFVTLDEMRAGRREFLRKHHEVDSDLVRKNFDSFAFSPFDVCNDRFIRMAFIGGLADGIQESLFGPGPQPRRTQLICQAAVLGSLIRTLSTLSEVLLARNEEDNVKE